MKKSEFLDVALETVKEAEKIIMHYFSKGVEVEFKEDNSPVTVADKEAEKIIREKIKDAFPDHGFLGEEYGKTDQDAEYIWIIDPIDGTKNFIRRIPLFATQIALMKEDELILGVSNAPLLGELLYAEKGKGAFLNDKSIKASEIEKIADAFITFASINAFSKKGLLSNICNLINDSARDRGYGDFYLYHLIANGRSDVAVEASLNIWDIAAAAVIVEEAGGKVTDILGNPVNMDIHTVIATNRLLHNQVVSYFKEPSNKVNTDFFDH